MATASSEIRRPFTSRPGSNGDSTLLIPYGRRRGAKLASAEAKHNEIILPSDRGRKTLGTICYRSTISCDDDALDPASSQGERGQTAGTLLGNYASKAS